MASPKQLARVNRVRTVQLTLARAAQAQAQAQVASEAALNARIAQLAAAIAPAQAAGAAMRAPIGARTAARDEIEHHGNHDAATTMRQPRRGGQSGLRPGLDANRSRDQRVKRAVLFRLSRHPREPRPTLGVELREIARLHGAQPCF